MCVNFCRKAITQSTPIFRMINVGKEGQVATDLLTIHCTALDYRNENWEQIQSGRMEAPASTSMRLQLSKSGKYSL